MAIEVGQTGNLVKVTSVDVDDDGYFVCFDYRNGISGWFEPRDDEYTVGDVLLLVTDNRNNVQAQKMPPGAWPDALWVGVVRIKLPDITVIDSGLRSVTVPTTNEPRYEIGNTVQAGDTCGVVRVLSKTPIKRIDLPGLDDDDIERFRWKPDDGHTHRFDDFGGLTPVVARARELIEVPLQNREALGEIGARPIKGVLFTGEPGTGKTMLARIIASQSKAAFYEVSGPEIFSKWYGQSEELLRKVFEAAAAQEKAIIFFDEIDSVAGQRGNLSHEASTRVVAQLLTLMDGFEPDANVVVIAATNRPQDLDVALRRPGRFDWEIEFPYPGQLDREDILIKTARPLRTNDPLPHAIIAAMSDGWSAAELAAIWSESALLAVEDGRRKIYEEDYIGGFERVLRYRHQGQNNTQSGDVK